MDSLPWTSCDNEWNSNSSCVVLTAVQVKLIVIMHLHIAACMVIDSIARESDLLMPALALKHFKKYRRAMELWW